MAGSPSAAAFWRCARSASGVGSVRLRIGHVCGLFLLLSGASRAGEAPACDLSPTGTAQIQSVLDGRTLTLADGRQLRLAGIEAAETAKRALEQAVPGRELTLFRLGPDHDRYGRIVALAAPNGGGVEQSAQHLLLAQGHARVLGNLD